jgi:uncharacterized protein with von Willebrand factor type A (vWA) domain
MQANSPAHNGSADPDIFLNNMLSLVHLLRHAGLQISTEQVKDFLRALIWVNIGSRDQVYHAARCVFVTRHEHLRLFETIFNAFWRQPVENRPLRGQKAPVAPRHDQHRQPALVTYMARKARESDPEVDVVDKSFTYTDLEIFQQKDFSTMMPEELDTVKRLIQDMRWKVCFRRSRRKTANPMGDNLHMRRVMASAVRHGGVPVTLAWRSRKIKPRPVILIADISGSMEKYSRLVLQFFYAMSHSLKDVECFVFGTRITRITTQLKVKNIDTAINDAAHVVLDWSGGTRIGESLLVFNRQWGRRLLRRGAIVMIVSDGWERGNVDTLRDQMRYLQLRCYRLIWLNPLIGKSGYQPHVEGMAAALQFVDDFLPIHNLQSLSTLATHLASLST